MIDLLIDEKNERSSSGALQRPKAVFSWLSRNQSCFVTKAKPPRADDERGDVIRWSIFDLSRRAAFYSLPFFLCQNRGYSSYEALLNFLFRFFNNRLKSQGFVTAICQTLPNCISRTIIDAAGNPIFYIISLCFGLSLLFVVYRVIKRAITKV